MLCLKEWLELDAIRTHVYYPSLEDVMVEMAMKKTISFLVESVGEDEDEEPATIDDPFVGDEDAAPVSVSEDEPEDEEQSSGDIEIGDSKKRELAKALRNAALWIRWSGMLERKRAIEQLQAMRSKEDPSYRPVRENSEEDDPFEDIMKSDFNILDTVPILEKLGYIDMNKINDDPTISDEKKDAIIRQAFRDATEEAGNDLPPGVAAEEIERNAKKARQDFFNILRSVFDRQYNQLSRSSRNSGIGGSGLKLYDTDELANNFILRMMSKIAKRPRKKGSLKPWPGLRSDQSDFGKLGLKELESDEFVDEILDHFKRLLYKEPAKAEDERRITLSPSRGAKDEYSNRDKKSSRINVDVKQALKDQSEGKTPESLDFYIDILKASKQGAEKSYDPDSMQEKDKFRLEIMTDILAKASRNPAILSLDPSKIIATLQNYRTYFLKRSKGGPSFMSAMGSKDDEGSSWDAASPTDDEKAYGRGATSQSDAGLSGRNATPSTQALGNETRQMLIRKFRMAMNSLRQKNSKWALAVCLKFDLNCLPNGSINVNDSVLMNVFSGLSLQRTSTGEIKGEKKTDCKNQLNAIGLSKEMVGQWIARELGDQKQATVDSWIDKGLEFLCQELSRLLSDMESPAEPAQTSNVVPATPLTPMPRHAYVKPKFDASKPSPLSGMLKRNQG